MELWSTLVCQILTDMYDASLHSTLVYAATSNYIPAQKGERKQGRGETSERNIEDHRYAEVPCFFTPELRVYY